MTKFIKYIFIALIAIVALGLGGCKKKEEKKERPDKLEVVSLDKVSGSITDGLKVTMTIKNNSGFNVRITAAEVSSQNQRKTVTLHYPYFFTLTTVLQIICNRLIPVLLGNGV